MPTSFDPTILNVALTYICAAGVKWAAKDAATKTHLRLLAVLLATVSTVVLNATEGNLVPDNLTQLYAVVAEAFVVWGGAEVANNLVGFFKSLTAKRKA